MTRTYSQLSDVERRKLEQWRVAKISIDVIAQKLGRQRATIFRELKRNRFQDIIVPHITGYFFKVAKMKSATRSAKDCKLIPQTGLKNLDVLQCLLRSKACYYLYKLVTVGGHGNGICPYPTFSRILVRP